MAVRFLLLDKNDITKVCGVISKKDALKEMGASALHRILENGTLFRGKYYLVEEEFKAEQKEYFDEVRILENRCGDYYVTINGEFFVIYKKSKKKKMISKVNKRGTVCVRIGEKQYTAKNLVAQTFIKGTKKWDIVTQQDGDIFNCAVDNLEVIKRSELSKKVGGLARSKTVGLYENDKLVKTWSSASACARDMYCSIRCVCDYCNAKRSKEKQMFDVRWI